MTTREEYFNEADAIRYMMTTRRAFRAYVRARCIKPIRRPGRCALYRRADIDAYVQSCHEAHDSFMAAFGGVTQNKGTPADV